jgi:hypothetical protein
LLWWKSLDFCPFFFSKVSEEKSKIWKKNIPIGPNSYSPWWTARFIYPSHSFLFLAFWFRDVSVEWTRGWSEPSEPSAAFNGVNKK